MADRIESRLHFVWVGAVIPTRQASCVLSFAIKNPLYNVTLWTNRPQENATAMKGVVDSMKTTLTAGGVRGTGNASVLSFRVKATGQAIEIDLVAVTLLHGELGPEMKTRYEEELNERNYGGASDILRIAILKREGGIYLDTDSDAMLELRALDAPDGIMFGVLEGRGFCNAVIAAPEGHGYLQEILEAIRSDYNYWERGGMLAEYRQGVTDARAKVARAVEVAKTRQLLDHMAAGRAKVDFAADPGQIATDAKVRAAKTQLQQVMSSGTLLITGPTRVALWLYGHIGGNADPIRWATDNGVPLADCNTPLKLAELMGVFQNSVVKPMLSQPDILQRYGFPSQYVRINSEASWIK
jgi:TcdA/TcdB catalytic glycosyltransferase domain